MPRAPEIIPISDLRQNASDVIKGMSSSREPVFITQRGKAAAVMVSMAVYERSQHEMDVLHLLARGEKEIPTWSRFCICSPTIGPKAWGVV
jgi:prevent-host-death family protein